MQPLPCPAGWQESAARCPGFPSPRSVRLNSSLGAVLGTPPGRMGHGTELHVASIFPDSRLASHWDIGFLTQRAEEPTGGPVTSPWSWVSDMLPRSSPATASGLWSFSSGGGSGGLSLHAVPCGPATSCSGGNGWHGLTGYRTGKGPWETSGMIHFKYKDDCKFYIQIKASPKI